MLTKDEIAADIIFTSLEVGLDGADDAFADNEIGMIQPGDGGMVREITIDGITYEVFVSAKRRAVA